MAIETSLMVPDPLLLIIEKMSHLKALVFSTAMINFLILTTYQLFYGGSQSIKYHANLNFEVLKESSLGKNSIIHRGHKQVEE